MQIKRWKRFGLLASVIWVIVGGLLAFRNETWIAAWRLYCSFTADPTCVGTTVFLVVHWGAIAGIVMYPLFLAWLIAELVALRRRIRRSRRGV
jgi:MFS superfamily sulfate permease-like transporter